jgi:sugar phosphate isomerase/epimerase
MIASWFLRGADAPGGMALRKVSARIIASARASVGELGIIAAKAKVSGMGMSGRRGFVAGMAASGLLAGLGRSVRADVAGHGTRRMTRDLVCGNLGVKATQREAIDFASRHGFESVFPDAGELGRLSDAELAGLLGDMKAKALVFGAGFLAVDFRKDDATFERGLGELPGFARGLQRAGVQRVGTWLPPASDTLTYRQYFALHARRLREVARVLQDHGLRLGLEYVGPKTAWASRRYPFLHTLAETRELIAEIGAANVGLVLDTWHWYHAGDSAADVAALKNQEVVAVDLNDAPAGVPKDQMVDSARELPLATGVIDAAPFLRALAAIDYDGPVRAEPFNDGVRKMPREEAVAATAQSMKKAFALLEAD